MQLSKSTLRSLLAEEVQDKLSEVLSNVQLLTVGRVLCCRDVFGACGVRCVGRLRA